MTDADLRALLDAATKGPWAYRPHVYSDWGEFCAPDGYIVGKASTNFVTYDDMARHRLDKTDPVEANARLMIAARNFLGEEVLRLRAENARLRGVVKLYEDALTEAEAIFGGEYADDYGPMFEMAWKAREGKSALGDAP